MKKNLLNTFLSFIALISTLMLSSCTQTYKTDDFIFIPPPGFETTQYAEGDNIESSGASERLIFSKGPDIAFWVNRKKIPPGSDFNEVFDSYRIENEKSKSELNYQFIDQNNIEHDGHPAIEYIYRQYSGEWYWQRREIWIEINGMIYSLVCSEPVDSTPGKEIPVTDLCLKLADRFSVKNH
jgi:hypothetical protein